MFTRTVSCAVAACALAAAAAPAAALDFVYGSWIPEAEYTNRVALPKAFEEIAAESDVNWRLVPGGQLVNPVDTWDAVENGLVQGGMGIPQYVPSVVPTLNVIYQTVLPGDETLAASGAALETLMLDCPQCLDELRGLNMLAIAGWDTAPYMLGCTTPVRSVADLKGLKVRAAGGNVRLMEAAGATPVAATLVEAISLLQTGAIDCIFGTAGWYRSFGYADFIRYHTDYPMGMTGPATGWLMNRDAWNQLSDDDKTLHLQKGAMVSAMQALGQFVEEEKQTLDWAVNEKGVEVVEPDAEEFADADGRLHRRAGPGRDRDRHLAGRREPRGDHRHLPRELRQVEGPDRGRREHRRADPALLGPDLLADRHRHVLRRGGPAPAGPQAGARPCNDRCGGSRGR